MVSPTFTGVVDFGSAVFEKTYPGTGCSVVTSGGVIGGIGKAVGKGLSDAQKAAGKAIDKLSGDKGEIVIDFGEGKPKAPAALRERAKTIRAEAELKQAAGDQEGARELRAKAYALETEADDVEKKHAELAEAHSKHVQSAIQAGLRRRSFLKGVGMQRNCAPPAAPAGFVPRRG